MKCLVTGRLKKASHDCCQRCITVILDGWVKSMVALTKLTDCAREASSSQLVPALNNSTKQRRAGEEIWVEDDQAPGN